jgi:hypothetical protein
MYWRAGCLRGPTSHPALKSADQSWLMGAVTRLNRIFERMQYELSNLIDMIENPPTWGHGVSKSSFCGHLCFVVLKPR